MYGNDWVGGGVINMMAPRKHTTTANSLGMTVVNEIASASSSGERKNSDDAASLASVPRSVSLACTLLLDPLPAAPEVTLQRLLTRAKGDNYAEAAAFIMYQNRCQAAFLAAPIQQHALHAAQELINALGASEESPPHDVALNLYGAVEFAALSLYGLSMSALAVKGEDYPYLVFPAATGDDPLLLRDDLCLALARLACHRSCDASDPDSSSRCRRVTADLSEWFLTPSIWRHVQQTVEACLTQLGSCSDGASPPREAEDGTPAPATNQKEASNTAAAPEQLSSSFTSPSQQRSGRILMSLPHQMMRKFTQGKYRFATASSELLRRLQLRLTAPSPPPPISSSESLSTLFSIAPEAIIVQCLCAVERRFLMNLNTAYSATSFLQFICPFLFPLGDTRPHLLHDWHLLRDAMGAALSSSLENVGLVSPSFKPRNDDAVSLLRWFAMDHPAEDVFASLTTVAPSPLCTVTVHPSDVREGFVALLCIMLEIEPLCRDSPLYRVFLSFLPPGALLALLNDRRCSLYSLPFAAVGSALSPILRVFGCDERVLDDSLRGTVLASPPTTLIPAVFAMASFPLHAWYALPPSGNAEQQQQQQHPTATIASADALLRAAVQRLVMLLRLDEDNGAASTEAVKAFAAAGTFVSQWVQRYQAAMSAGRREADAACSFFFGTLEALRWVYLDIEQGHLCLFQDHYDPSRIKRAIENFVSLLSRRLNRVTRLAASVAFAPLRITGLISGSAVPPHADSWVQQLWMCFVPRPARAADLPRVFDDAKKGINVSKLQYAGTETAVLAVKQRCSYPSETLAAQLDAAATRYEESIRSFIDAIKTAATGRHAVATAAASDEARPEKSSRRSGNCRPPPGVPLGHALAQHIVLQSLNSVRCTSHLVHLVNAILCEGDLRTDLGTTTIPFLNVLMDAGSRFILDGTAKEVQGVVAFQSQFLTHVCQPTMREALQNSVAAPQPQEQRTPEELKTAQEQRTRTTNAAPATRRPNPMHMTAIGAPAGDLMKAVVRWSDAVVRNIVGRIKETPRHRQSLFAALSAVREVHSFALTIRRTQVALHDAVSSVISPASPARGSGRHASSKSNSVIQSQDPAPVPLHLALLSALISGYRDRAGKVPHLASLWELAGLETIAAGLSTAPVVPGSTTTAPVVTGSTTTAGVAAKPDTTRLQQKRSASSGLLSPQSQRAQPLAEEGDAAKRRRSDQDKRGTATKQQQLQGSTSSGGSLPAPLNTSESSSTVLP